MMAGEFRKFDRRQDAQQLFCELYVMMLPLETGDDGRTVSSLHACPEPKKRNEVI
jgi:hypothetical protein